MKIQTFIWCTTSLDNVYKSEKGLSNIINEISSGCLLLYKREVAAPIERPQSALKINNYIQYK